MRVKKDNIIQLTWFVVVISLLIFSFKILRSGELEAQVANFGLLAPLALIVLKAATLIIAPLGGSPLYIIAGVLFGTAKGFIYTFIGDVLGSITCFILGRTFGKRIVKMLAGEKYFGKVMGITSLLDRGKSFLKARIAIMTIPELLAYAAGLSKISFWTFVFIHCIFYIPLDLALVFLGDSVTLFSIKYIIMLYAGIAVLTAAGFLLLYKDYEKMEGM